MAGWLGAVPFLQPVPDNEWGRLALHLASEHADPVALQRGLRDNAEQHEHEHDGPGTIRNHDRASRDFDLRKARVLEMFADEWGAVIRDA
jgi:hypothetical protein